VAISDPRRDPPDPDKLWPADAAGDKVLYEFLAAPTWSESRWSVEQHPELLSEGTDLALGKMLLYVQMQGDTGKAELFEEHRRLLRRCREVGVDAAFQEIAGRPVEAVSSEVMWLLEQVGRSIVDYERTRDRAALDIAIRNAEQRLGLIDAAPRWYQWEILRGVGMLRLNRFLAGHDRSDLDKATGCWERGLALAGRRVADLSASFHGFGGMVLGIRYNETRDLADVEQAIEALEQAVAKASPDSPQELLQYQRNLRAALAARYERLGNRDDLERAIALAP
jgi:hypothetical protein